MRRMTSLRDALGVERAHVAAEELGHRDAVDALGRGVGEQDAPLEVGADDRVDRRVDDALEEVLRLVELVLDGALRGHVAERAEDDALLAEHRVEVDAEDRRARRSSAGCGRRRSAGSAPRVKPDAQLVGERRVLAREEVADAAAAQVRLAVARDGARARVREEQVPLGVDDDDAVGRALEEVGVALEGAQAPLGLEARDGDLLRLVAERLHDARVAERDGHRVRDGLAEIELAVAEGERVPARAGRARPSGAPRRGWAGWRAS